MHPHLVEMFVQPAFSAVINGTTLALDGRTKPFADSLEERRARACLEPKSIAPEHNEKLRDSRVDFRLQ